jgi:hypothetical protein
MAGYAMHGGLRAGARAIPRARPNLYIPRREIHYAATGTMRNFDFSKVKKNDTVSTYDRRKQVEAVNPDIHEHIKMAEALGARVRFGIDARELHDPAHYDPVPEDHQLHLRFPRSPEKTPAADEKLLADIFASHAKADYGGRDPEVAIASTTHKDAPITEELATRAASSQGYRQTRRTEFSDPTPVEDVERKIHRLNRNLTHVQYDFKKGASDKL